MSQRGNRFEKVWRGLDGLLLAAVFILLGAVWVSTQRGTGTGSALPAAGEREPASVRKPPVAGRVVDGVRVSAGRARVSTFARSMVASDWESAPPAPAMDMREEGDGREYEILFALPERVDRESVRVSVAGDVLTLTMRDGVCGKTYAQQIRIPCGVDVDGCVRSVVSNGLLHVRISPVER